MEPVTTLTGNKFQKSGKKLTEQVEEFFATIGNTVEREDFGDIVLDKTGIKSSIGHGIG